jgi:hypothetical protein
MRRGVRDYLLFDCCFIFVDRCFILHFIVFNFRLLVEPHEYLPPFNLALKDFVTYNVVDAGQVSKIAFSVFLSSVFVSFFVSLSFFLFLSSLLRILSDWPGECG